MTQDLVRYEERGIVWLRTPMDVADLAGVMGMLNYMVKNISWAYGDAYNRAVDLFSEEAAQLLPSPDDVSPKTLMNWCFVSRAYPPETRIYRLTFSHYSEVASVEAGRRHELLSAAERDSWSTARLRKEAFGTKHRDHRICQCPNCGKDLEIDGGTLVLLPEVVKVGTDEPQNMAQDGSDRQNGAL